MVMRSIAALVLTMATVAAAPLLAQPGVRERALPPYRLGMESMRAEAWAEAARHFQNAIDIDPTFETAFYMLGRANMPQRKYVEAVAALTRARDLYLAAAGKQFTSAQEAQRYWRDQIVAIDEVLRQLQTGAQTMQVQDQIRQVNERKRQIQEVIQRGTNLSVNVTVPAFVSLSLGSAYFRMGNLAEAEKAYKAAIDTDNRAGEAHNNLAVVYLETGRLSEAEKSVAAAEKAGFKVHPQLKQDIKDRKRGT
jgi:tetratricopeptide (TPR) repeat protein